ncbi:CPBP family intramembrane glutamic endopeptidase [Nonomuraea typhae]|uniref:CPBP family intramembrane glutamic endopeptidase n=1 Tax=Nonomuraea typhae TaxID=2603600 RepID=UPI0012FC947B|nr:type II CAAX endopeptidase family protein [Nonomuraea typhae]
MRTIESRASRLTFTVTCGALFVLAYGWLVLTGHTEIVPSSGSGAPPITLWSAFVPALAAIALAMLVPPRTEPPLPLQDLPRERLVKESRILVGAAVLMAIAAPFARDLLYYGAKILFLLVIPLVAFRVIRGSQPKARSIPKPVTWLAPLPAVVAWFVLSQLGPLAPPMPSGLPDMVTLVVLSLLTLLTASVLEEFFYRAWLQTRLEVLYGRWPAIMASSLLFAAMHTTRIKPEDPLLGIATIIAFQGVFGLLTGYLWSRYRNLWVPVFIHVVTNLVFVQMLLNLL